MANENDRNQGNQNTPSDKNPDRIQDRRDPNTGTPGDRSAQGGQTGNKGDQKSQNPGQPDQRSKKPGDMNEDDDV